MDKVITILSGVAFSPNEPSFVIDKFHHKKSERCRVPVLGKTFTITADVKKYCIGRYDLASFASFPCPDGVELTGRKEKICYACFQYNGFNPSFYHVPPNTLSTKQRVYNSHPHVVYLAAFGIPGIKVGISNKARVLTRWCEQGALAAAIIGEFPDAYAARELEEAINTKCSLPDIFKKNSKRGLLKDSRDFEKLSAHIKQVLEDIRNIIPVTTDSELNILNLNKLYYGNVKIDPSFVDLTDEAKSTISGNCCGVIGDTLIMMNNQVQFVISLGKFIGYTISFQEKQVPVEFKPRQQQLF